ncbi:hypothetical protein Tco_1439514 [Tanacetum coccineum]
MGPSRALSGCTKLLPTIGRRLPKTRITMMQPSRITCPWLNLKLPSFKPSRKARAKPMHGKELHHFLNLYISKISGGLLLICSSNMVDSYCWYCFYDVIYCKENNVDDFRNEIHLVFKSLRACLVGRNNPKEMEMKTFLLFGILEESDLKGMHVDLNVSLDDNFNITDDTRIRAAIKSKQG